MRPAGERGHPHLDVGGQPDQLPDPHQNPTTEPLLAGTLRTGSTVNANFNGSAGEVWVVAITGGLESESNHFRYSGNGSGASCVAVK